MNTYREFFNPDNSGISGLAKLAGILGFRIAIP